MSDTLRHLYPTTVPEAVQAFHSYQVVQGRAPLTIRQYKPVLRDFAAMFEERAPGSVRSEELQHFLASWIADFQERRGRTPGGHTVKNVIIALRSFYSYLERFGLLVDEEYRPAFNPTRALDVPSIPQKVNDWLRQAEDDALLAAEMNDDEQALIWLLRWSGCRLGEALSLTVPDVDLSEGNIYVRKSKTARGIRAIPLVPELHPRLTRWFFVLNSRGLYSSNAYVFSTRHRNPWTEQYAEKLVRRVAMRAELRLDDKGIARVSPHTLRRTFGSDLLNRGVRLEVVSRLLGHSSTQVTERCYAELLAQTVRREMLEVLGAS